MKRNSSLNHVFRLIWNQATRAWVAVAETSRGRGKSGRTQRSALAAVVLAMPLAAAQAAPAGGQVTAGSGSVSHSGATTTVKQNSAAMSMSWQSFNIGKSETVNFVQPTARSIAVNRILDTHGSQILGRLNANGQVWLINPNGLLFGRGAQVNVGGLVASTLDVSDDSLNGSTHRFAGKSTAGVVNQGRISAAEGGSVVLLGHHVSNTGTISAQLGTVALGAGNATTLQFEGSRLVNLRVDDHLLDALADNGGLLQADGGQVLMSAGARNSVLASVVNNTGVIEARTVEQSEGRIVLLGGMAAGTTNVAGTLDASAPQGGNGGFIETSAAHVKVADGTRITTAAPLGQTGTWLIDPTDFTIAADGGDITGAALSTQLINNDVVIQSTSGAEGSAGDINVNDAVSWSIYKLTLNAYNDININAALNGSGTASLAFEYGQGTLTGATSNYNINAPVSLPAGPNFSTKQGSDVAVAPLVWQVITDLGLAGRTTGADLQGINGNLSGHYVLGADIDATATAGWNAGEGFAPIGNNNSGGAFIGSFDGLGHTIGHLTINRPSDDNVGLFGYAGSGSTISNVGMTDVAISGKNSVGGLVGFNDFGTVTNSYAAGGVSGVNSVGGLVGVNNAGAISNTYATGSVSGTNEVGGLVGYHEGTISNSYATGSVSGTAYVGGLVGYIDYQCTVTNSYATGSVSGTTYVGGLVGYSSGTISGSHATGGSVNPRELVLTLINSGSLPGFISGNDNVGGLVGFNAVTGSISSSYAANNVGGNDNVGGLVGNNEGGISTSYAAGSGLSGPLLDYIASLDLTQTDTLTASVRGNTAVGGLVGLNAASGTITDSYATGSVHGDSDTAVVGGLVGDNLGSITSTYATGRVSSSGNTPVGGLVGSNNGGTITNSYWDKDTTGQDNGVGNVANVSSGAIGLSTTAALERESRYDGFDFDPNTGSWYMVEGSTRPFLQMEHSLTITNARQLQMMGMDLSESYTLANNIDLAAELADASGMWGGSAAGFAPVGSNATRFTGSFDGQGHTIGHLTINRSSENNVGLFGYAGAGSDIRNVGLTDATLTGQNAVGALVGYNYLGAITSSYATGSVSGTDNVGALVGYNYLGAITSSYATGSVSGTTYVGALVGYNRVGAITSSYATGSVIGSGGYVGALVGYNLGAITSSYATGSVSGKDNVGALVGYNSLGAITRSYATGSVSGTDNVGALVGYNSLGAITSSYATGSVSGTGDSVGALVGYNSLGAITRSYATGSVSGTTEVGGLVGYNSRGAITSSYATGSVSGTGDSVGGLVGYNSRGAITNSYATGSVSGTTYVGGLVGTNSGTVSKSLWDIDTTGQEVGIGGGSRLSGATGLHTAELLNLANYTSATDANGNVNPNWDFTNTWFMVNGSTRPFLRMEYSTTITNAHQLQMMAMDRTAHYTLANDIDLGPELANASGMWGGLARTDSAGFAPIGTFVDTSDFSTGFTGSFDGQSHTIAHLTIRRDNELNVGLIGFASYGSTISNVGMTDVAVAGFKSVGGLVGDNDGAISNSYVTGSVSGTTHVGGLVGVNYDGSISNSYATASVIGDTRVGGLVGDNRSSITNSYATGSVTGGEGVGGLVGDNSDTGTNGGIGTISNSFASGSVSGFVNVGGLVGDNSNSGTVSNSLWDIATTGQSVGIGGLHADQTGATGLSTADLLNLANYTTANGNPNWDFTNTWYMVDGSTRPFLRMEYSTTITNAHQLQLMGMDLGAHYTLAGNIDLAAELADASGMWGGSAAGFAPIGGIGLGLPNILGADLGNPTAFMNGTAPDLSALGNWGTAAAGVNAMSVLDGLGVFNGSFDGQGHSIGHLTVSRGDIGVGLFGVAIGADIRNVSLTDANVAGFLGVGALVGINALGTISDSSVSGEVFGLAVVGGLAGVNALGTISDSSVSGAVGGLGVVGGLVGLQLAGTITGSHASGEFVGLIGVGGLVGGQALSLVQDSYASGSVEGALGGAGGLVGINLLSAVSTSYSDAEVSGTAFVGGLVGINLIGLVDNSYATGGVYGEDYVGGLVGGNPGLIRSSYASGSVSGSEGAGHVGGLTGGNLGEVIGSYWDIESSGQEFGIGTAAENQSGVTGLSTADALTQAGYGVVAPVGFYGALNNDPGLDFNNTWYLVEGSTRPFLRMEHSTTISNAHQLQLMGLDPTAHYTLANDIDLGPELTNASGMWGGLARTDSAGFAPIGAEGDAFTGSFDGQGHTIDHLTINRSSDSFVGLFGYAGSGSAISNVGLNHAEISGDNNVGALAGYSNGTISNSYASGSVAGTQYVGGLVGEVGSVGSVATSYSAADVSGTDHVGGLVGEDLGTISNSYATGSVSGDTNVGGLVGTGHKAIVNSYASGFVSGEGDNVGGLAGSIDGGGYVIGSYWDVDSTGQAFGVGSNHTASGVIGLATTDAALLQDSYAGFDFNNTWYVVEDSTRPFLRMEHSTTIRNAHQLQLMSLDLTAHYTLANDICLCAELNNASSMWGGMARDQSAGFVPIGDSTTAFTGSFDGQGYGINNLIIKRSVSTDSVGLFGWATGGAISNVSLTNVDVSGGDYVGGLVGFTDGSVTDSIVTGSVSGRSYVGGLVGLNTSGTISNSYATGSVTGTAGVGGLVGINLGGNISDSYATGDVSGVASVGGLVGSNIEGAISGSYATGSVTGVPPILVGSNLVNQQGSFYVPEAGIGGLAGTNVAGAISDSYATGAVSGDTAVGGLVGYNEVGDVGPRVVTVCSINANCGSSPTISNSYATGAVSGNTDVGGLVGINDGGTVTSSYWNITSTGQASSAGGGVGLTQAQMTSAASYDGWDFDNTWVIYEGHTAPLLRSFMTALTVTVDYGEGATKVYDATTVYNGGTVDGYSLDDADTARIYGAVTGTLSSSHVGTRTVEAGGLYSDQQGYIISYTSANNTVEVTPATLTYQANAASFFNGQTPTGLSGTLTGWMGDDTLASATSGSISWTTSALSSSYPGYYDITGGGLTASDYVFVQAAGNATALTLNPARLPDEVSAVTTQMTSTLPIIKAENAIALSTRRSDPGWRAVGLGVRLPDDAVSSEVAP
jgi:filamentous hemagglutinin family protein